MPFITREDGVHFVIPSYRDVLSAKSQAGLKKEILLLSQSYGEYITMQKKGALRFEVAFSPDTGYLLGESVWQHFKQPLDMIYCEAIPDTAEVIMVIVKSGSVYLDGQFLVDSIPEELVIFLTQENNFDIFVYGDVPISQQAEEGKFAFEESSVHSFKILEKPVFNELPLLKQYQLQAVEPVLKAQGIGVFPVKNVMIIIAVVALGWMMWPILFPAKEEVKATEEQVNPYQTYIDTLQSPDPEVQINDLISLLKTLYTLPGWDAKDIIYTPGNLSVSVTTAGSKVEELSAWISQHDATMSIQQNGIYINMSISVKNREFPAKIFALKDVLATFIDRIAAVYPGNRIQLAEFSENVVYRSVKLSITLDKVTPLILKMISDQLKGLPLVLQDVKLQMDGGEYSGTISLVALGS